jgi:hypothetical protein
MLNFSIVKLLITELQDDAVLRFSCTMLQYNF